MSGTATGGSDAGARIAEWVAENYEAQQVSGATVYDLSWHAQRTHRQATRPTQPGSRPWSP